MTVSGSYCRYCGARNQTSSKFCSNCGKATSLAAEAGGVGGVKRKRETGGTPPLSAPAPPIVHYKKDRGTSPKPAKPTTIRTHIRNGRTKILVSFAVILIGIVVEEYTLGLLIWLGVGLLIGGLIQYAYGRHKESKEQEERELGGGR